MTPRVRNPMLHHMGEFECGRDVPYDETVRDYPVVLIYCDDDC